MSEERIRGTLRREAAREWPSTPDLWPSVEATLQQRFHAGPGRVWPREDTPAEAQTGQATPASTIEPARSWPRELGKMAAGAAFVALLALVLAAVYSGQQGILPGVGEEDVAPAGGEVVTGGETLITRWSDDREVHDLLAVDAGTGEQSDRIPPVSLGSSGLNTPVGISQDGSRLAAISADETIGQEYASGTQTWPRANLLTIVDTETGETAEHALPDDGWVPLSPAVQFSPDGETLALVYDRVEGATIMLFDAESTERITERSLGERLGFMEYRANGNGLLISSQDVGDEPGTTRPGPPRIVSLDASTLETDWSVTLDGVASGWWCEANCDAPREEREAAGWNPAVALDPGGEHLYVAHVDQPVLERVDLDDQNRTTIEYEIAPDKPDELEYGSRRGGYAMARVSADGDIYLLFGGAEAYTVGFVELDLAEETGTVRSSGNAPDTGIPAEWIELMPDRSGVLLAGRESLIKYGIENEGFKERFSDWSAHPSFTLEGEPILLATQRNGEETRLGVVDPDTLEVGESWTAGDRTEWAGLPSWSYLANE